MAYFKGNSFRAHEFRPGLSRDVRLVTFGESVEGREAPLVSFVG